MAPWSSLMVPWSSHSEGHAVRRDQSEATPSPLPPPRPPAFQVGQPSRLSLPASFTPPPPWDARAHPGLRLPLRVVHQARRQHQQHPREPPPHRLRPGAAHKRAAYSTVNTATLNASNQKNTRGAAAHTESTDSSTIATTFNRMSPTMKAPTPADSRSPGRARSRISTMRRLRRPADPARTADPHSGRAAREPMTTRRGSYRTEPCGNATSLWQHNPPTRRQHAATPSRGPEKRTPAEARPRPRPPGPPVSSAVPWSSQSEAHARRPRPLDHLGGAVVSARRAKATTRDTQTPPPRPTAPTDHPTWPSLRSAPRRPRHQRQTTPSPPQNRAPAPPISVPWSSRSEGHARRLRPLDHLGGAVVSARRAKATTRDARTPAPPTD